MALERRTVPIEIRAVEGEQPTVSWYASVFDSLSEDLGGFREKIGRRAFTETLQQDDVRALFNHDPSYVLGRSTNGTLSMRVDLTGLNASVTPPDTQWARDLMVSVKRGDVTAGSFGFNVLEDKWGADEAGNIIREVKKVRLFDVSLVTYPAYPGTDGTVSMRSLLGDRYNDVMAEIAPAAPPPGGDGMWRLDNARLRLRMSERAIRIGGL